jgi:nicotinate-nucleotide pyrophosphorylase (carboxylating)
VSTAARTRDLIDLALAEDVGAGDVTTDATVPADAHGVATVVLREPGVICGLDAVREVFQRLDPDAQMEILLPDGTFVTEVPATVAAVSGAYRALLTGERTALNLLQRLSGVATATRTYVDAIEGTGAVILDTRKTAPGLRALDKHAVACGGGRNHRAGLDDAVLIKDNHVAIAGGIVPAVRAMRAARPDLPVEVEVDTLDQLDEALAERAEMILLDNMTTAQLREAVHRTDGRAWLEASGGITLDTARAIADTGVDALSVGALTHSVRALDVALEVTPSQP